MKFTPFIQGYMYLLVQQVTPLGKQEQGWNMAKVCALLKKSLYYKISGTITDLE